MASTLKEVVVVVHGVGDPAPGETLSLFTRSTTDPDQPAFEKKDSLWLHQEQSDSRFKSTFPVHTTTRLADDGQVVFAETFWGDLSQVRRGIFGVLRGLFEIIFGLRYVAYVAADQPNASARWLQRLGVFAARLLHGPLLAVNIILGVLLVTIAGTECLWPESSNIPWWSGTLIAANCAGLLVVSGTLWRIAKSSIWERLWFWVFIGSLLLGLQWFVIQFAPHRIGFDRQPWMYWYARVFVVTMSFIWFVLMLSVAAMGIAWIMARSKKGVNRTGLGVAFLLPAMTIGIWGQLLPMVWLLGQNALSRVATPSDAAGQEMSIALPFLLGPQLKVQKTESIARFDDLFQEAVPLLGIQCVMCVLLGVVQLAVFIYFAMWRPRNTVGSYLRGQRPPRLIVNLWVQLCCAACACIGVTLVLFLGWNGWTSLNAQAVVGPRQAWLLQVIADANKYAIALMVPLAGLFFVAFRYLSSALDIVLDVINHFCFARTDGKSRGPELDDEFDAGLSFAAGDLYFSRREMIQARLFQLVGALAGKCGNERPNLTVVCHSQGTVIAIEALNSHKLDWIRGRFATIQLVTMGSPFTHIYQHYFANHYPALDQPYWSNLRRNVDCWLNIFRVDDFVGTEIHFPESLRDSEGPACQNFPVERCGHNLYWSDKQVIDVLSRYGSFCWLPQPGNRDDVEADSSSTVVPLRRAG